METVNKSFMEAQLEPKSYDLILCIGDSLMLKICNRLAKLAPFADAGRDAIVECTDSSHFISSLTLTFEKLRTLVVRPQLPLCLRFSAIVERMFQGLGLASERHPTGTLCHCRLFRAFLVRRSTIEKFARFSWISPFKSQLVVGERAHLRFHEKEKTQASARSALHPKQLLIRLAGPEVSPFFAMNQ